MVVKSANGALVRMQDIAKVDLGAQSWTSSVAMNGQHAVFIGVQVTPDGNPLSLVQGVRALVPEIERNLPPSMKMQIAYDSTRFIQASLNEVYMSLGLAVGIVVVVIFLFLGSVRAVLIPIVTIPLSMIGAGILMAALGFSLNLLTLLAMVLAIGLVVDDAIVVVENVYRHIEEGKSPAAAALIGAREIAGPVITDDPYLGRGLRADRVSRRRHRRIVSRVRLHPGRIGADLGRHRGYLVADDVLDAAEPRSLRRAASPD